MFASTGALRGQGSRGSTLTPCIVTDELVLSLPPSSSPFARSHLPSHPRSSPPSATRARPPSLLRLSPRTAALARLAGHACASPLAHSLARFLARSAPHYAASAPLRFSTRARPRHTTPCAPRLSSLENSPVPCRSASHSARSSLRSTLRYAASLLALAPRRSSATKRSAPLLRPQSRARSSSNLASSFADSSRRPFQLAAPSLSSCVAKFFEVNAKVGERLQAMGGQAQQSGSFQQ